MTRQTQNTPGTNLDREDPEFKEKPGRKSAGAVTPGVGQPLSPRFYALIALVAGVLGTGLLVFYVYQVPKLEPGPRGQVYYVVLFPSALACAVALFGAMRSYARLSYKHLGIALELGGPVVLFCLIVFGGFKLVPAAPDVFDLTVRAHSADGSAPVITSGQITIDLDSDRRSIAIGSSGEADFKGIPARFRSANVGVLPQVDGYKQEWQHVVLKGAVLDVTLMRVPEPGIRLTGSIVPPPKDWTTLHVMVDGQPSVDGRVDSFGRFDFPVKGKAGDTIHLRIYGGTMLVYDNFETLPGPLSLTLTTM